VDRPPPRAPRAVGVAILKHRLYDIDFVINRTLVYGSLTVALALVYVGGGGGAAADLGLAHRRRLPARRRSFHLAIAALFNPLRRRVQAFVDRRFYRGKYDVAKTLGAFSARLRNETDLDALGDGWSGWCAKRCAPGTLVVAQASRVKKSVEREGAGRMSSRAAARLAWSLGILCAVLLAFSLLLLALNSFATLMTINRPRVASSSGSSMPCAASFPQDGASNAYLLVVNLASRRRSRGGCPDRLAPVLQLHRMAVLHRGLLAGVLVSPTSTPSTRCSPSLVPYRRRSSRVARLLGLAPAAGRHISLLPLFFPMVGHRRAAGGSWGGSPPWGWR
jgi:hypothetical protein